MLDDINGKIIFMGKTYEIWWWRKIMGHMNFENHVKINTKKVVRDMPKITKPSRTICKLCQHRKKSRVSFKTKEYTTSKPLELVHTGLCEPTITKNLQGDLSYFMFLIDYYTRMTWVTFLKNKSEAFEKFKEFKSLVENETNLKIKCLR
jgi:hypothetical protein